MHTGRNNGKLISNDSLKHGRVLYSCTSHNSNISDAHNRKKNKSEVCGRGKEYKTFPVALYTPANLFQPVAIIIYKDH